MSTPEVTSVVKVGNLWYDPFRVQYVKCSFCDQTSLRTKADIEHASSCPHSGGDE